MRSHSFLCAEVKRALWLLVPAAGLWACTGDIAATLPADDPTGTPGDPIRPGPGGGTTPGGPAPVAPAGLVAVPSGARMLSPTEYDNTLFDLLGDDTRAGSRQLPDPASDRQLPFANDYASKGSSDVLVQAVDKLAGEAALRAIARADVIARIVPCKPARPDDAACFKSFVEAFGRRALRRPLTAEEVTAFNVFLPFAAEKKDFLEAVRLTLSALLQHPEFIYRIELGREVANQPGVFRLDGYEVATRLAYFLTGSTPADDLLALAASGALATSDGIGAAARKLLVSARGKEQLFQFHAEWLGFAKLDHPADLTAAMYDETAALIEDIVLTKNADYRQILLADKTFIGDVLAKHYGLQAPGKSSWVGYGTSGRGGLLSHGTFLSAFAKPADTSPVNRGLFVNERLLCRHIPDPPADVNVDVLPDAKCRLEMFQKHLERGSTCAACHVAMDPVGFGLEQYDRTGKFRTAEEAQPDCKIDGKGQLGNLGTFNGPGQLGKLIAESGEFEGCVARQVYQFAVGRMPTDADRPVLDGLTKDFGARGRKLADLLVAVAAHPSFSYRRGNP